jgi:hypothetical protein
MSVYGITTTTGWMQYLIYGMIAVSGMETITGWQYLVCGNHCLVWKLLDSRMGYLVYGNHYKIAVSGMVSAEGHT